MVWQDLLRHRVADGVAVLLIYTTVYQPFVEDHPSESAPELRETLTQYTPPSLSSNSWQAQALPTCPLRPVITTLGFNTRELGGHSWKKHEEPEDKNLHFPSDTHLLRHAIRLFNPIYHLSCPQIPHKHSLPGLPGLPLRSNAGEDPGKTAERNMKNLRTRTHTSFILD